MAALAESPRGLKGEVGQLALLEQVVERRTGRLENGPMAHDDQKRPIGAECRHLLTDGNYCWF